MSASDGLSSEERRRAMRYKITIPVTVCFEVDADSRQEAETVAHLAVAQLTVNPMDDDQLAERGLCEVSVQWGESVEEA
jgi:hypothetical protein